MALSLEPKLTASLMASNSGEAASLSFNKICAETLYCFVAYLKYKNEGKNLFKGELTKEDWKEVGLNTAKASALGGVTGAAVYGLTNCAGLAAPLAGAFVTASKGVSSLVNDFYQGKLTFEEFQMNSIFVCADSAGVGLAALAGQTFIPIPVLGAVIGSIAGKFVCEILLGEDKKLAYYIFLNKKKEVKKGRKEEFITDYSTYDYRKRCKR